MYADDFHHSLWLYEPLAYWGVQFVPGNEYLYKFTIYI